MGDSWGHRSSKSKFGNVRVVEALHLTRHQSCRMTFSVVRAGPHRGGMLGLRLAQALNLNPNTHMFALIKQ